MITVYFLKGLQGSGKSTWAKEFIENNPSFKRINKDDIRTMIQNGKWSKESEKLVISIGKCIFLEMLAFGQDVILDNTHIEPYHLADTKYLIQISGQEVDLIVKTFDTPIEECIQRDAARVASVGETVIRNLNARWEKLK